MATVIGKCQLLLSTCTCGKCASIIEYAFIDVCKSSEKASMPVMGSINWTHGVREETYVNCPACKNKVVISSQFKPRRY